MTGDYTGNLSAKKIVAELLQLEILSHAALLLVQKKYPKVGGQLCNKTEILEELRKINFSIDKKVQKEKLLKLLQTKPTRTLSGVAPITVLTKPYPCPGKCIFCPSDIRMPKSYLSSEPGAQRAETNYFDPYLQTYGRLEALVNMGHSIDKAELLVLGGTWSFYPESYQIWFIKQCFAAFNDFGKRDEREKIIQLYEQKIKLLKESDNFYLSNNQKENEKNILGKQIEGSNFLETYNQKIAKLYTAPEKKLGLDNWQNSNWKELEAQQLQNEIGTIRCVGLVLETRPDAINDEEISRMRRFGCTKVQIGIQSLQEEVLVKNHRGHSVLATKNALKRLRQAGFKIHAHWMPNLYGSSVDLDKKDYAQLFSDGDVMPDELKIYPCSLLPSAELMQYYQRGEWRPYTEEELSEVLVYSLLNTPGFCRLTRIIRDIPSTEIVVGNKKTNFRQIIDEQLKKSGQVSQNIRDREIRSNSYDPQKIRLSSIVYKTSVGEENFLQYEAQVIDEKTKNENWKLLAFLRLSLPDQILAQNDTSRKIGCFNELNNTAIIREVHVYGQAQDIGSHIGSATQHIGLGQKLMERAKTISLERGYTDLAVISAIGTRGYYRKFGFVDGTYYQHLPLATA